MDKVRLGRALGYGARHAAKTVMQAVDAATAADPRTATAPENGMTSGGPGAAATEGAAGPATGMERSRQRASAAGAQTRRAARQAAGSFAAPLRRVSSVIFLQVTGSFFALLAIVFGTAAWRMSGGWRGGLHVSMVRGGGLQMVLLLGLTMMFAAFSVGNFVRARRRERR